MTDQIQFDDGAAYEHYMGVWSRIAGEAFLDWLAPPPGLKWLDVGCGNGAFTETLSDRCAPESVDGIDPSEAQLAYARARFSAREAHFQVGDAMALPFPDASFGAAVMPLVIFFVPVPARGVAEMARVVRPGGLVAAYGWDLLGGGFPFDPIWQEIRAADIALPLPPSPGAAQTEALRELWTSAGLQSLATREIVVERTFADFEDYWATSTIGGSVRPALGAMTPNDRAQLKERVRARLPADSMGR